MPVLPQPEPGRNRGPRRQRKLVAPPWRSLLRLEASPLLDEVPGVLGAVLWQRARDVALWSATPLHQRYGLFVEQDSEVCVPVFMVDPAGAKPLAPALRTFALLVVYPHSIPPDSVATACLQVSEWARSEGRTYAEGWFAELACLANPLDPDCAVNAGRVARRRAEHGRAIQWFRRSISLARAARDNGAHAVGYISWGILEEQRGGDDVARRLYEKAWRIAHRGKLRRLAAAARHNLLNLCHGADRLAEGQEHAEAALTGYGPRDERVPHLAHDVAVLWTFEGYFSVVLPIIEAVLPFANVESERIQFVSTIARAAAGLGDTERFFAAWDEVARYAARRQDAAAPALNNVAHGARSLRLHDRVREIATQAAQIASKRGERRFEADALALLNVTDPPPMDRNRPPPEDVAAFAAKLLTIVRQQAASR